MSLLNGAGGPDGTACAWTQIIRQLSVCNRQLRRQLAAAANSIGASDTEFLLLASLHADDRDGLFQSELAAAVGVSAGQVSGLVEGLRSRGWIQLDTSPGDRRRHQCGLTDLGRQNLQAGWRALAERAAQWDVQLPQAERTRLAALLADLLTAASAQAQESSAAAGDAARRGNRDREAA